MYAIRLSNQESRIMKHMSEHRLKNTDDEHYGCGTIHAMGAWNDCGVYRLSAVIHTLRKKGYDILTRSKKVTNQFGEPCTIGQYILAGPLTTQKFDNTTIGAES